MQVPQRTSSLPTGEQGLHSFDIGRGYFLLLLRSACIYSRMTITYIYFYEIIIDFMKWRWDCPYQSKRKRKVRRKYSKKRTKKTRRKSSNIHTRMESSALIGSMGNNDSRSKYIKFLTMFHPKKSWYNFLDKKVGNWKEIIFPVSCKTSQ